MKERVALVGGSFSRESAQGQGTALYVRIPVSLQQNGEIAQWTN
jgi:signal transduction histidine kinase